MRAVNMSGAEFLASIDRPQELMGMAESEGSWRDRHSAKLDAALSGSLEIHPRPPETEFVTLSEVARLNRRVSELGNQIHRLTQMVRFLVERTPGSGPSEGASGSKLS